MFRSIVMGGGRKRIASVLNSAVPHGADGGRGVLWHRPAPTVRIAVQPHLSRRFLNLPAGEAGASLPFAASHLSTSPVPVLPGCYGERDRWILNYIKNKLDELSTTTKDVRTLLKLTRFTVDQIDAMVLELKKKGGFQIKTAGAQGVIYSLILFAMTYLVYCLLHWLELINFNQCLNYFATKVLNDEESKDLLKKMGRVIADGAAGVFNPLSWNWNWSWFSKKEVSIPSATAEELAEQVMSFGFIVLAILSDTKRDKVYEVYILHALMYIGSQRTETYEKMLKLLAEQGFIDREVDCGKEEFPYYRARPDTLLACMEGTMKRKIIDAIKMGNHAGLL